MGLLPRTMIQCLLWCYVIAFYLSRAEEVKRESFFYCYINPAWSADYGVMEEIELDDGESLFCSIEVRFNVMNGTFTSPKFRFSSWGMPSDISENPLLCYLWDRDKSKPLYAEDEEEFSQYDGRIEAVCYCNESAICATQPETFESYLDTPRFTSRFYAMKAAEIILKFLRKGLLPNNAREALKEFMGTSSTLTSTEEAITTEPSTTAETSTTTEIPTTATSTISTEISTTATSTTSTETPPTSTSTTTGGTSTTFATTSDYEHSDTSTTSAYEHSSTAADTALFTVSDAEVAEVQQLNSFLEQYGLVIAVAFGILLILVIAIIAYTMRKGKVKKDLEGAIGKRGTSKSKESTGTSKKGTSKSKEFGEAPKGGTSKSKESKGTSKEGSKESKTSKTKESGSKEKKTGSKD